MIAIASCLQAVNQRIREAAAACGRELDEIRLLAISKTWSAAAVGEAYAAGQLAFGESYVQEAMEKIGLLAELGKPPPGALESRMGAAIGNGSIEDGTPGLAAEISLPTDVRPVFRPLEWHFVGPIQSNKTRQIAEHFAWVHSVDRLSIAERLSRARPSHLPDLQICLQINVSGEASKSGAAPDSTLELARAASRLPKLRLRGLMTIPRPDFGEQRAQFARLYELRQVVLRDGIPLDTLSMGMSDDLEAAIAEGATIVRVGTAIFGPRDRR